ncbi:MAG: hypothetical protein IPL25_19290 [Saprospiraceae bacterium]|nr:hypothetical protein [Candidatus Vicinibacter affinis]
MSSADFIELVNFIKEDSLKIDVDQSRKLFKLFNALTNRNYFFSREVKAWIEQGDNFLKAELIKVDDIEKTSATLMDTNGQKNEEPEDEETN